MASGLFIKGRRLWLMGAFVTALMLAWLVWPESKSASAPPLPSPNGYDDFMKAGRLLASISFDHTKMLADELRAYVGTNQEPRRLVRLGLERECQVPTEDSTAYIQSHLPALSSVKALAQLLSAEGRLAEAEERYDAAAKIHLEVIHFGQAAARGGLIIDKLVGVAIENIGLTGLERMFSHLNAESGRATLRALEELDARADSAAEYLRRDREWARKAYGWRGRIQVMWLTKTFFPDRLTAQHFIPRVVAADRRRRQLLLNLAARAFELESGRRPVRTEDLAPAVLRLIPKDPETGTNLVLTLAP
jgi:hypothetical protein